MRKNKPVAIMMLIAFILTLIPSMSFAGQAEFPKGVYKTGYSEAQKKDLVKNDDFKKRVYDIRQSPQGYGIAARYWYETPRAGFDVRVNGKLTSANRSTFLDLDPVYLEVKSTDKLEFKNTSALAQWYWYDTPRVCNMFIA